MSLSLAAGVSQVARLLIYGPFTLWNVLNLSCTPSSQNVQFAARAHVYKIKHAHAIQRHQPLSLHILHSQRRRNCSLSRSAADLFATGAPAAAAATISVATTAAIPIGNTFHTHNVDVEGLGHLLLGAQQ